VNPILDDDEVFFHDSGYDDEDDAEPGHRSGLVTKLIILLLILALLGTLVWPLLRVRHRYFPTPTPTPLFLREI
jgi:hypothetical protein